MKDKDNKCDWRVSEWEIALVLCFRFCSRSALSPDVKSVSIVWLTGGVIGNVSWQQHFSLTLWELAQRQRERGMEGGVLREGDREERKEETRMTEREGRGWCCWADWHTKKPCLVTIRTRMTLNWKSVCIFVCQGTVLPLFIVTVRMNEMPVHVCVCTHACHVSEWQETVTLSISKSWRELETHNCHPTAHTGPLPHWPFLNVTGHLAHWLGF